MLQQASVDQVRRQEIPRENSHIVIAMCYYPRGIKKEWRDDYRADLAPSRELFAEWKEFEKQAGHDEAFRLSHYEERFQLTPVALYLLKKYAEENRDTYLVCQCKVGERCHREMLLLTGREKYGARVGEIYNSYPIFQKRIAQLDDTLKLW